MKRHLYILLVGVVWLLSGCNHKDLCYSHPHAIDLKVTFDWASLPDAMPEGMCVYFYSTTNRTASWQRFDYDSRLGGKATLHVGTYHAVFYNNDTSGVLFANTDSFIDHYLYTREGSILEPIYGNSGAVSPRAQGAEDERVVICPDIVWGGFAIDIEVTDFGVTYSYVASRGNEMVSVEIPQKELVLYPTEQTAIYTYEINTVENLKYASLMCGSLTGVSAGVTMAYRELSPECVTIPFESEVDVASSRITGEFVTFGHNPDNNVTHNFVLYVIFDNGEKYYYTFDVTDQVDNAPDPSRVHIVIDKLTLPTPIYNGGGFDVGVDDWVDVNVDIVL